MKSSDVPASSRKRLRLVLVGVLFGLLVGEAALRLFLPMPDLHATRGMYRTDAQLAYRMTPGFSYLEDSLNACGFRGGEWRRGGAKRIAFFGDSFTFGSGIARYDSTFVGVAERELRSADDGIAVFNFGTPGYSTIQSLLLYSAERKSTLAGIDPDTIVLCFFLGNDAHDNATGNLSVQVIDGNLATYTPSWIRRTLDPLLKHVALYTWARIAFRALREKWQSKPSKDFFQEVIREDAFALLRKDCATRDPWKRGWSETERALAEWKRDIDADSRAFVIVLVPDLVQLDAEIAAKFARENGLAADGYDTMLPNRMLTEIAGRIGIPVFDLTPKLAREIDPQRLYIPYDGHFSERGSELAGSAIAKFLATTTGEL